MKFKRTGAVAAVTVGVYAYDKWMQDGAMGRTMYAVGNAAVMGVDYKLNFKAGKDIHQLHQRNAERLYKVITHNKGLYVKIGQSIAIQGSVLPTPYKELLSKLYDDAPVDSWELCEKTLNQALNCDYKEVFSEIDHNAVASASIAQVHRARLHSGEPVAVKIQHHDIPSSVAWDLGTYKALTWFFSTFVFRMPMYFAGKYIADMVAEETDFDIEVRNSNVMADLVRSDKETNGKLHVPKIYEELSSKRVLVMEWIEGVSLSQQQAVRSAGFDVKSALKLVFTTLTKEAFDWGVVHCDPHPGNWILRRVNGKQQLVMLDHGLYVYMSPKLRTEYSQLWRAMFKQDLPEITRITTEWGFGDAKLFASATMLQPYDGDDMSPESSFGAEEEQAERMRSFLKDTEKIPLELIFVGRTQRILQGLNQLYGSPVNRVHLLVDAALQVPGANAGIWDWVYRRTLLLVADIVYGFLQVKRFFTKEDPEEAIEVQIQKGGSALMR